MKKLRTEILIQASTEKVWSLLTDRSAYPDWNPFIIAWTGELRVGEKQQIKLLPDPEGKPFPISPRLKVKQEGQEIAWLGHLGIPGLFDGYHYFQLERVGEGQTRLIHGEHFSGILRRIVMAIVGENTRKGFEAMNQALKEKAERVEAIG
ncbi:MAG: SRPBCC domain-containing protein [Bacteroidota bacterium]